MLTPRWTPLMRHAFVVAVALGFAASIARAESEPGASAPADSANAVSFSSSSASLPDGMNLAAEPSPAGNGAQYDRSAAYRRRGLTSHLAFEAGGGFNAPTPDTSNYLT